MVCGLLIFLWVYGCTVLRNVQMASEVRGTSFNGILISVSTTNAQFDFAFVVPFKDNPETGFK